jgi:hypothetical protein
MKGYQMKQLTKALAADLTVCGLRSRPATLEELRALLAEMQAQNGDAPHESGREAQNAEFSP